MGAGEVRGATARRQPIIIGEMAAWIAGREEAGRWANSAVKEILKT
jgi:hypothetical protein